MQVAPIGRDGWRISGNCLRYIFSSSVTTKLFHNEKNWPNGNKKKKENGKSTSNYWALFLPDGRLGKVFPSDYLSGIIHPLFQSFVLL